MDQTQAYLKLQQDFFFYIASISVPFTKLSGAQAAVAQPSRAAAAVYPAHLLQEITF